MESNVFKIYKFGYGCARDAVPRQLGLRQVRTQALLGNGLAEMYQSE